MLGRGSTGVVFEARDETLDVEVAVKLLDDSRGDSFERLRREIVVGRFLAHPNVCRVHDFGVCNDRAFITMELVRGTKLSEAIREGVEYERAIHILDCVCDALEAAHAQGVTHRDLGPENIMLAEDGRVVVMGVGLRAEPASVESDLYALGMLALQLLSRELDDADRGHTLDRVPQSYRAVLAKCVHQQLHRRYPSARALRIALRYAARRNRFSSRPPRHVAQ
jgi:tRNA A-37 threonylcarbamoyl transferase component Bud32